MSFLCFLPLLYNATVQELPNRSLPVWTSFMLEFLGECAACGVDEGKVWEMCEGNVYFVQFEIMLTLLVLFYHCLIIRVVYW